MNMKDLLQKKFTCLRDNMEIYGSITYVEPCSLPLYLLFKPQTSLKRDVAI